jgi:Tol biopolymer transport system component
MDADGANQRPLTADQAINAYPVVCAGGRYIVYTSVREGAPQVWRMDIDGGSPMALSKEMPSLQATCAPDGATVVYNAVEGGARQGVWRIAIEGGQPERIAEHQFSAQALSPDGTLAAGTGWDEERRRQSIGILDLSSAASVKLLPISPRAMSWMPAGRVLGYVDSKDGADNVWTVAYGGGAPTLQTRFADQFIFAFAWSRDGKQLALSRGTVSTDVVLLTATR